MSDNCFDVVGDATSVMAGWSVEDVEACTVHAGPLDAEPVVSCSRNVSPSMAFRFPLPPLITLFKLPYAD